MQTMCPQGYLPRGTPLAAKAVQVARAAGFSILRRPSSVGHGVSFRAWGGNIERHSRPATCSAGGSPCSSGPSNGRDDAGPAGSHAQASSSDADPSSRGADATQRAAHQGESDEHQSIGAPLTLGSEVLQRMAKLRALDQYRQLIAGFSSSAGTSSPSTVFYSRRRRRAVPQQQNTSAASAAAGGAGDDSALLLRGSLLIARHRYPSLDERKVYDMLDEMARRVAALLPADPAERYPLRVVAAINRVLYTDYGFRGNEEDYYNADNSCINRVMERRVGIPITLSLVYSEVASRAGLPMRGLNLPGHFMLQPLRPFVRRQPPPDVSGSGTSSSNSSESEEAVAEGAARPAIRVQGAAASSADSQAGRTAASAAAADGGKGEEEEEEEGGTPLEVLVDAFKAGEICLPGDAEERISAVLGSPVRIDPRVLKESQPLPPRLFLLRMLSNLRSIYLSTQQVELLLDVLKFMRATLLEEEAEEAEEEDHDEGDGGQASNRQGRLSTSASSASVFSSAPSSTSPLGTDFPLAAASQALARDEGLCYFALRRYPECVEALREYVRRAEQSGNGPLPAEEIHMVSAVMEEARKRMTQQRQ